MRRLMATLVAAAVVLGAAPAALSAITMTFRGGFTTGTASTKDKLRPTTDFIDFEIADDAGIQPSPLRRVVTYHDAPVPFNGRFFPRCKLAALKSGGPAACPRGSRVGTGTASGSARPLVDSVKARLTLFNGDLRAGIPSVLIYVKPELGPTFTVADVIKRRPDGTYTDNVEIPPIPTLPGYPNAATTSVHLRTLNVFAKRKVWKRIGGRRVARTVKLPYIAAPTVCDGRWTYSGEFTFESGETRKLSATQRCTKG
jgi:hypothetical protein